jgi:hypothetical protein
MRIGIAEVRMGGIGGVGTPEKHRNKGYSRRCLENSNVWMAEEGFDCATLFGISDYYDKFGYAPCLAWNTWTLPTRDAERAELRLNVRPMGENDFPALHDLYAQNNAALTGSIVRNDRAKWVQKGSWYGTPAETFVFTDDAGVVVAYAIRDKAARNWYPSSCRSRRPKPCSFKTRSCWHSETGRRSTRPHGSCVRRACG